MGIRGRSPTVLATVVGTLVRVSGWVFVVLKKYPIQRSSRTQQINPCMHVMKNRGQVLDDIHHVTGFRHHSDRLPQTSPYRHHHRHQKFL